MNTQSERFTLAQWSDMYGVQIARSASGYAVRVFEDDMPLRGTKAGNDARWNLFHLADYVVSAAISGPAYALRQRNP